MKKFIKTFFILVSVSFFTPNIYAQVTATWALTTNGNVALTGTDAGNVSGQAYSTENSGACSAGTFCVAGTGGNGLRVRMAGSVACRSKDFFFQMSPSSTYNLVVNKISFLVTGYAGAGLTIQVEYTPNNGGNYYTLGTFSGGTAATTVPLANGSTVSYNLAANNTCSVGTAGTFLLRLEPYWSASTTNYFTIGSVVMTGSCNSSTPVEMTTFTANTIGETVTLNWNTASEVDNTGWEVQRAFVPADSNKVPSNYEQLGFVQGNINSNSPKSYNYVDNSTKQNGNYYYRLKQINNDGTYKYYYLNNVVNIDIPLAYTLNQNYPNPFNPSTTISYEIPTASKVMIKIYNTLGDEIATLVNENKEAGRYSVVFNASSYVSGVYLYKIQAGNFVQTKKMILLK
jgi:hypothetical protein